MHTIHSGDGGGGVHNSCVYGFAPSIGLKSPSAVHFSAFASIYPTCSTCTVPSSTELDVSP